MTADDAPVPTYAEQASEDSRFVGTWIDSMAARAGELGLPLTHGAKSQYALLNSRPLLLDPVANEQSLDEFQTAAAAAIAVEEAAETPPSRAMAAMKAMVRQLAVAEEQQAIVDAFFTAVRGGRTDVVTQFVQKGLVSPDVHEGATTAMMLETTATKAMKPRADGDKEDPFASFMLGTTPLLAAVEAGRVAMVRTLLALGADVDRMAVPSGYAPERGVVRVAWVDQAPAVARRLGQAPPWAPEYAREGRAMREALQEARLLQRTPLMVAAATGRLAMVELLLHRAAAEGLPGASASGAAGAAADDAVVAPDGQTALRLAAAAGHRDVVAVLPVRRGGAGRRFQLRHAAAMARARRAAAALGAVARGVAWDIPKLVVWDAPRAAVAWVREIGGVAALARRAGRAIGRVASRMASGLAKMLRALPAALREAALWLVRDLPAKLARTARAAGRALLRFGAWAGNAVATLGGVLARTAVRAASALHTAALALWTRLRAATLADVAHGLRTAAAALFVGLPLWLAHVLRRLGATTADALKTVFGCLGAAVVVLAQLLASALLYVPKQLWRLAAAGGSSVAAAAHEAAVFVNPKL